LLCIVYFYLFFFFSSRRRHTRFSRDWSSDVCSSDLLWLLLDGYSLLLYSYGKPLYIDTLLQYSINVSFIQINQRLDSYNLVLHRNTAILSSDSELLCSVTQFPPRH